MLVISSQKRTVSISEEHYLMKLMLNFKIKYDEYKIPSN